MNKVSVIVPVYNAQNYLERCMDSILRQTYTDIEVLLVDDGSTDDSAVLCKNYVSKDARVKYIFQNNTGPDYARKKGVEAATGRYLTFVDADDYVDEDMIRRLYGQLQMMDCDLVCSQVKRVDDSGRLWDSISIPAEGICCNSVHESMNQFFVTRYLSGSYYAKLYKRELLEEYGFVQDSLIGEDITAILYVIQRAKKVFIVPDSFYYYYWNGNSISHSGYTERHYVSLMNYIKVRDELLSGQYVDRQYIVGFFAEYEMAVATAMSRNWMKDPKAISVLRDDLREHRSDILRNELTPLYMKVCILLFGTMPHVFMLMYRMLYLLTGR